MLKRTVIANILLFGFLLGIYEGKVALWKDNQKKPIKVFPYQASQLPEADQERLRQGVHVDSIGELYKLIEDYFS
jgi:hypothetical protein